MISLPVLLALLAEIRAAGPCPEPEGERIPAEQITSMTIFGGYSSIMARGLRQLRADLARLAAEVERLTPPVAWQPHSTKGPHMTREPPDDR